LSAPAITIITAVYNRGNDLSNTINSIKRCGYKNIQYIVIDGASTDNTLSVIKQNEACIYKWISEKDKGVYDAMNKGWRLANEDSYILFLGAGDELISLPALDKDAPDIIFGNVKKGHHFTFHSTADVRLRMGNTLHHQALLIKKKLHPSPPFDLQFPVYADFDFNQRLLKDGYKFTKDSDFLSFANEGGLSAEFQKKEALAIVKKNFGNFWVMAAKLYYALQKIYYRIK